jgi:hypothetical protein
MRKRNIWRKIHSALHVLGFCIGEFSQPQIKNIWEKEFKKVPKAHF